MRADEVKPGDQIIWKSVPRTVSTNTLAPMDVCLQLGNAQVRAIEFAPLHGHPQGIWSTPEVELALLEIPASEQRITVNGVDVIVELRMDGTVRVDVEWNENANLFKPAPADVFVNGVSFNEEF